MRQSPNGNGSKALPPMAPQACCPAMGVLSAG